MVRKRPRVQERAEGTVYAVTPRERDRLVMSLLEKQERAA